MSVAGSYTPAENTGNGSTTAFPFTFPFFAQGDIVVVLYDTTAKALVSPQPVLNGGATYDYTIASTSDPNTGESPNGTVTFVTAPLGNHRISIRRATAITQPTSFVTNGALAAKTVESTVDRQAMVNQEQDFVATRTLAAPKGDANATTLTLPPAATRAGYALGFDTNGNPVMVSSAGNVVGQWLGAWSSVTAYAIGGVVSSAGASYIAIAASTNQQPPNATYWAVVAAAGAPGGAASLDYFWDSGTASADPGATLLRFNNASAAATTAIYIDTTSVNGNVAALIDTFDQSTNTVKGALRLYKKTDPTKFAIWQITARSGSGAWRTLTLTYVAASSTTPFANGDEIMACFDRAGDVGAAGPVSTATYAHFRQEQANNTNPADSLTINTWSQRVLNVTKVNTIAGCSIGSNNITLPAGTYELMATAAGGNNASGLMATRFRNITDSTTVMVSSSDGCGTNPGTNVLQGQFTIAGAKAFDLETYITASAPVGGIKINSGEVEVYCDIYLRKIA